MSGEGCGPDSDVTISLDGSDVAKTGIDSGGAFRAPVRIPDDTEPGDHTVTAIGRDCGASKSITVLAAGASDDDSSWRIVAAVSIWLTGIVLAAAVVAVLRWDTVRSRHADGDS